MFVQPTPEDTPLVFGSETVLQAPSFGTLSGTPRNLETARDVGSSAAEASPTSPVKRNTRKSLFRTAPAEIFPEDEPQGSQPLPLIQRGSSMELVKRQQSYGRPATAPTQPAFQGRKTLTGGRSSLTAKAAAAATQHMEKSPKNIRSHRTMKFEQLCADKRKTVRVQEQRTRRATALPPAEIKTVMTALDFCAGDESGSLDVDGLRRCIAELGLVGRCQAERAELAHDLGEVAAHKSSSESIPAETEDEPACVEGQLSRGQLSSSSKSPTLAEYGVFDIAVDVVPRVRKLLEGHCREELEKMLGLEPFQAKCEVQLAVCARVAWTMGVDQRSFVKAALELCGRSGKLEHAADGEGCEVGANDLGLSFAPIGIAPVLAAKAIVSCREQVLKVLRARERDICASIGIEGDTFTEMRSQIIVFYEAYAFFGPPEAQRIDWKEVRDLMRDLGCFPHKGGQRDQFEKDLLACLDAMPCKTFGFQEFVAYACFQMDQRRKMFGPALNKEFSLYDRNDTGQVSVANASQMLSDLGLVPRTRGQQDEIKLLLDELDADGSGILSRRGFQTLYLRVEARFRQLEYEEWHEATCAAGADLSEAELRNVWHAFDEVNIEATVSINIAQVREALDALHRNAENPQISALFADFGSDGLIDLTGFALLAAQVPKAGMSEAESMTLATRLTRGSVGALARQSTMLTISGLLRPPEDEVPEWAMPPGLRRALWCMRLPRDYVQSLADKELAMVVLEYFGLEEEPEVLHRALTKELDIHGESCLVEASKALGLEMVVDGAQDLHRIAPPALPKIAPDEAEKDLGTTSSTVAGTTPSMASRASIMPPSGE